MSTTGRNLWMPAAAALVLGLTAGCATHGYVNSRMKDLQDTMGQRIDKVQTDLGTVRNSADQAQARADAAFGAAGESKDLALGKVGYHEVTQATVHFAFDKDALDDASRSTLDDIAAQIQARPELLVDVYGFTDPRGSEVYNFGLGQRRADAVMRYLVDKTPGQLTRYAAISYGKTKLLGSEQGTKEANAQERRVVVSLVERVTPGGPAETPSTQNLEPQSQQQQR